VFFVTQNPIDVPDKVLGQLGNRVQHALRAFTPRDQKAVAAAAQTFRPNPKLNTAQVITELARGEALVSFLEGNGTPAMVERVMVRPPSARIGPITVEERAKIQSNSPVKGKYDVTVDAESAYEVLQKRVGQTAQPGVPGAPQGEAPAGGGWLGGLGGMIGGIFGTNRPRGTRLTPGQAVARDVTRAVTNRIAGQIAGNLGKSIGGSMGNTVGRAIVRGALGGILRR
jgi:DNA helicase HerA-like ATPase